MNEEHEEHSEQHAAPQGDPEAPPSDDAPDTPAEAHTQPAAEPQNTSEPESEPECEPEPQSESHAQQDAPDTAADPQAPDTPPGQVHHNNVNQYFYGELNASGAQFGLGAAGSDNARRRAVGRLDAGEADAILAPYVKPACFEQAALALEQDGVVVLVGPPATGKRSGAVALVDALADGSEYVVLSPGRSLDDLASGKVAFEKGVGYLLLDRMGEDSSQTADFDWRRVRDTVREHDARLVVTTVHCADGGAVESVRHVPWQLPDLTAVLRVRLVRAECARDTVERAVSLMPGGCRIAEVAVGNEQKVADYRGMLVSCNPTDGAATTDRPECARYQLKVAGSPAELARQIKTNGDRTAALRTQVADINKTLNDKLATEQRLCGPKYWIWRGGVRDVTITCERAREATSEYEKNSKIKTYEKQLEAMVDHGQTLSARKDRAADDYQPLLQRAIDDKTRQRAADLDTDGILTRAHGLKEVAESDGFALFLTIVLHLLLLCLDAMPVLAKALSGATTYDTLLGARHRASRRLFAEELEVQHTCARLEHDVQRHRVQLDTTDRMRRLDHEHQRAQAERAARERAELEARMGRIMRARGRVTDPV